MSAVNRKKQGGFTIIEVVLVLAIAALIFLMIFVALPALQRGQKNTARKNDVGIIASAINSYRSNKSGALPTADAAGATAMKPYIDKLSQIDPSSITIQKGNGQSLGGKGVTDLDKATIYTAAKCGDTTIEVSGTKSAAVVTTIETSASNYDGYCQDV